MQIGFLKRVVARGPVVPPAVAMLLATALVAAGCGSSSKSSTASSGASAASTTSSASTSSPLGTPGKAPSGTPITLGMINDIGGAGSFPEVQAAALAAINYINQYRGGVHGHPLKLSYCVSTGDPSASANCANGFVSSKPLAVLGGADLGSSGSLPILQHAGIPYIGGMGFNPQDLVDPDSIQWTSASRALSAGTGVFVGDELKPSRVAVIYYNNISAGANELAATEAGLKAAGVKDITAIGRSDTATDETPAIAAAAKARPQVVIDSNAGNTCVSEINATHELIPTAKLVTSMQCAAPQTLKSVGGNANGMYMTSDYAALSDTANPDVRLFLAAMKKWAPTASLIETAEEGFSVVMNTAAALDALPASKLNGNDLLKWFKTARNRPSFLQSPYSCQGQYPSSSSMCRGGIQAMQYENGVAKLVSPKWFDGMKYVPATSS